DPADHAADDRGPSDAEDPAVAQVAGEDLDERLEDDVEGEQPEGRGVSPVMRRLERARQRAPRVLQQARQAHDKPRGHDYDPAGVAENLLWFVTDTSRTRRYWLVCSARRAPGRLLCVGVVPPE